MIVTDILSFYEEIKDELKFQNTSSVRTKIMISLSEGPKKTKDLVKLTGIQSSTILHGINELEKQDVIFREEDTFVLSEIGKIMALKLVDMIKTSISLKKFQRLLLNHEINDIPSDLLMNIGDLSDSKLIESDNIDIFKVHGTHMDILLKSKEVRGVSPIYYPNYTQLFKSLIENDIKVELILTQGILKKTIESLNNGRKDLKKLTSTGNLTLWELNKDIKVAFTITDKFMTMGFFSTNGMYDSTKNLISNDIHALAWGNKLFEYYRKQANKVIL